MALPRSGRYRCARDTYARYACGAARQSRLETEALARGLGAAILTAPNSGHFPSAASPSQHLLASLHSLTHTHARLEATPKMATAQNVDYAPPAYTSTRLDADVFHPHDPLSAREISLASACFRTEMLNRGVRSLKSCAVTLLERELFPSQTVGGLSSAPHANLFETCAFLLLQRLLRTAPKAEVIAYLGLPTSPTDFTPNKTGVRPARRAEAHLIDVLTGDFYVAACTFPREGSRPTLDGVEKMPKGVQPAITMEELDEAEQVVRNDPEIIRLCAEVGEFAGLYDERKAQD